MVKAHVQFVIYVTPLRLLFKSPRFSVVESSVFLFKGRREAGKEGERLALDMEGTCRCKMPFIIIWYIAKYSNFV